MKKADLVKENRRLRELCRKAELAIPWREDGRNDRLLDALSKVANSRYREIDKSKE